MLLCRCGLACPHHRIRGHVDAAQNVREVVMDYVAAGVDPERSTVFRQLT